MCWNKCGRERASPRGERGSTPGLDAICRKAMALKPEDRYGSPLELAEEVEHWLADEPVRRLPGAGKSPARRWMRKHPSRVTAAAVLLLATVVGLTIGAVPLGREPAIGRTASTGKRELPGSPGSRRYLPDKGERGEVAGGAAAPAVAEGIAHVGCWTTT